MVEVNNMLTNMVIGLSPFMKKYIIYYHYVSTLFAMVISY